MPQVHGAVRHGVATARDVVQRELNAAVDNPLIFWEGDEPIALSGGNFHGEPLALAMDQLGTAMAELGNISERRIARLLDPALNEGLPAFLVMDSGLNSGLMILQYTAAALASENKVLAHPDSVDTIPTSANTEDHVSMGPAAARHALQIIQNVETIVAIELMTASQALDFRGARQGAGLGAGTHAAYHHVRSRVPLLARDAIVYPYIQEALDTVQDGSLLDVMDDLWSRAKATAPGLSGSQSGSPS
jgi:histidine ammonia-lyase